MIRRKLGAALELIDGTSEFVKVIDAEHGEAVMQCRPSRVVGLVFEPPLEDASEPLIVGTRDVQAVERREQCGR